MKYAIVFKLNGAYRQDIVILNINGGKPIKFRMEENSVKSLKLSSGCYIAAAIWKETKTGEKEFYRYINPIMFFVDNNLSIELEQIEEGMFEQV